MFNHGGIVGYVYGQQRLPFFVRVNRSPAIQTFTALHVTTRGLDYDEYFAPSYDALVDGPALVCRADTARFTVKGTDVLVAICGSKRNKPLATVYAQALQKATNAVAVFLPSMPVSSYAFLIYLWDADTVNVKRSKYAQGALEHSLSSLYFWRFSELPRGIEEIAAHEFLHILLPLHVHSKEIDAFDYRYPKMSKHLWLYEGVTEYFAHQSQLRGAVTTEEQFIQQLSANAKIISYLPNTFAFTDFSENVLSPENQKLYPAIYQIGPLNALLLDILLRTESSGSLGLLELVYKLMEKYGPSIPFDDDSLFVEIERITNPAVREYLEKYVGNTSPLPLQSYLSTIGLEYLDSTKVSVLTFGVEFNQEVSSPDSIVIEPGDVNPLGVQRGDVLRKVNGTTMKPGSWHILQRLVNNTSQDPITITVERNGTLLDLAAPPVQTLEIVRHVIRSVPQPTEKQRSLRRLVFYGKS